MQNKISTYDFSEHLFWDVDIQQFDMENNANQMIYKVLEYGTWNDWLLLKKYYGLEKIKEVSLQLRSLDAVTLSFLSVYFNIEKSEFRCYKHKQLISNYWNS